MSLFRYTAIDGRGATKHGMLDEADKGSVAKRLMGMGLRPLEISPHREGKEKKFSFSLASFIKPKMSKSDIDFFTTQIALLLNAGLSLDGALRVMRQNSRKPVFKNFTGEIERKLKEGKSFSEALADYPYFSPMYINIAKAGEEGGILSDMLMKISEYQKTFQELMSFVISSSIYPAFLLLVGVGMVVILLTFILPKFDILFQGLDKQLPVHVRFMMDASKVVSGNLLVSFLVVAIPPAALIYFFSTEQGRDYYDRQALRLPLLSGFVRDLETTRIFRTLEVLVKNGVHLATSLKICSGVASNREYQRLLHNATRALKEGQQIAPKLQGGGLFPDLAIDLLAIGEESGSVGLVCGQIADHFEDELKVRIKRLMAMIEPCFILLIALGAGYMVFSMLSVIMSINDIAS